MSYRFEAGTEDNYVPPNIVCRFVEKKYRGKFGQFILAIKISLSFVLLLRHLSETWNAWNSAECIASQLFPDKPVCAAENINAIVRSFANISILSQPKTRVTFVSYVWQDCRRLCMAISENDLRSFC